MLHIIAVSAESIMTLHDPFHSQGQDLLYSQIWSSHRLYIHCSPISSWHYFIHMWQCVLHKWHVRVHTHKAICAWLPNLRLLWWVLTEEARGRSRVPVIYHGKQRKLWWPCDPGVWGSQGSVRFFSPCGHIWAVMSVKGNDCKCEPRKIQFKFY